MFVYFHNLFPLENELNEHDFKKIIMPTSNTRMILVFFLLYYLYVHMGLKNYFVDIREN